MMKVLVMMTPLLRLLRLLRLLLLLLLLLLLSSLVCAPSQCMYRLSGSSV